MTSLSAELGRHQPRFWERVLAISWGLVILICAAAGYIAYRDVKLSAGVMLWIEFASLALIVTVLALLMLRMRTVLNERKAGTLRLNAGVAPAPRPARERAMPAHPGRS